MIQRSVVWILHREVLCLDGRRNCRRPGLGQRRVDDGQSTLALDVVHFPDPKHAA